MWWLFLMLCIILLWCLFFYHLLTIRKSSKKLYHLLIRHPSIPMLVRTQHISSPITHKFILDIVTWWCLMMFCTVLIPSCLVARQSLYRSLLNIASGLNNNVPPPPVPPPPSQHQAAFINNSRKILTSHLILLFLFLLVLFLPTNTLSHSPTRPHNLLHFFDALKIDWYKFDLRLNSNQWNQLESWIKVLNSCTFWLKHFVRLPFTFPLSLLFSDLLILFVWSLPAYLVVKKRFKIFINNQ